MANATSAPATTTTASRYHDCQQYFGWPVDEPNEFPKDEWMPEAVVFRIIMACCWGLLAAMWVSKLYEVMFITMPKANSKKVYLHPPWWLKIIGVLVLVIGVGPALPEHLLNIFFYWIFLGTETWSVACYAGYLPRGLEFSIGQAMPWFGGCFVVSVCIGWILPWLMTMGDEGSVMFKDLVAVDTRPTMAEKPDRLILIGPVADSGLTVLPTLSAAVKKLKEKKPDATLHVVIWGVWDPVLLAWYKNNIEVMELKDVAVLQPVTGKELRDGLPFQPASFDQIIVPYPDSNQLVPFEVKKNQVGCMEEDKLAKQFIPFVRERLLPLLKKGGAISLTGGEKYAALLQKEAEWDGDMGGCVFTDEKGEPFAGGAGDKKKWVKQDFDYTVCLLKQSDEESKGGEGPDKTKEVKAAALKRTATRMDMHAEAREPNLEPKQLMMVRAATVLILLCTWVLLLTCVVTNFDLLKEPKEPKKENGEACVGWHQNWAMVMLNWTKGFVFFGGASIPLFEAQSKAKAQTVGNAIFVWFSQYFVPLVTLNLVIALASWMPSFVANTAFCEEKAAVKDNVGLAFGLAYGFLFKCLSDMYFKQREEMKKKEKEKDHPEVEMSEEAAI